MCPKKGLHQASSDPTDKQESHLRAVCVPKRGFFGLSLIRGSQKKGLALKNGGAGGHRAAGAAGPGLQRAGSPQAFSDRPAGVPGPAGPDECTGGCGFARRRGPADPGAQAQEPGEVGSRGAQRPAAGGPGGFLSEHQRAEQVRAGGARRLHPGDRHQGAARQAGGNGDAGGRGDHPLARPGGGQLRRHHLGNEFRGLEGALPGGAVHRQKDPTDRNATAVVDRAIQTLKKDLAGMVARRGGGWGEHVDEAAEACNARPHQAVTVAPEDVETMPAATFRVYQDNARKFKHNDELTRSRQRRLDEAGAFRAPTNAARSFQPQYGPARDLASFDSMVFRGTDGSETLLKHALPVPRGSAEPVARLTRRPVPLAVRQLRDFNRAPQPRLLT